MRAIVHISDLPESISNDVQSILAEEDSYEADLEAQIFERTILGRHRVQSRERSRDYKRRKRTAHLRR